MYAFKIGDRVFHRSDRFEGVIKDYKKGEHSTLYVVDKGEGQVRLCLESDLISAEEAAARARGESRNPFLQFTANYPDDEY